MACEAHGCAAGAHGRGRRGGATRLRWFVMRVRDRVPRTSSSLSGRDGRGSSHGDWFSSPHRQELLSLYAEVDGLLQGWACACTAGQTDPRCCRFDETGREPYPTRVELEEVVHATRLVPSLPRNARRLPLARRSGQAPCPLLTRDGRCSIYAARPLGCRTFFCREAHGPDGPRSKAPRDAIAAIGRRIADLSARFSPRDPHPRPLVRALGTMLR